MVECFTTYANKIEGRIDPHFYRPTFIKIDRKIKSLVFKKLRDISLDLKNGSTPAGGVFEKEGIPYFRSQDFNLFDFRINQFISLEFHKQLMRSAIKPGDVLIAVVGATLGVIGYVPKEIKEGNINQNVARVRVIDKNVNPKYLAIFLASDLGQELIFRAATITTQAYLNNQQLGDIEVPFPSLDIQNNIVQIMEDAYKIKKEKEIEAKQLLDSINDYVLDELGIKLPELKDRMCYVVFAEEVKGHRIDPKKYTERPRSILKAIQESKYKTEELKSIITDSISGEWGEEPYSELSNLNDYILCKVIRNTNFVNKTNLDLTGVAERLINKNKFNKITLKDGDLLIEKSGGSPIQPVGRVALIKGLGKDYTFSNFLQCLRVNKNICLPEYLFGYLKAIYHLNYMEYLQNQTTGIKNLIMEEFLSIPVCIPPLVAQNKIADKVKIRMQKAEQLQKEAKEELEKAKQKVEKIILGE